jgi:urea transporter
MSRARLCLVLGAAEIFLCCSKTVGAFGLLGVVEQALRASVMSIAGNMIFLVITVALRLKG